MSEFGTKRGAHDLARHKANETRMQDVHAHKSIALEKHTHEKTRGHEHTRRRHDAKSVIVFHKEMLADDHAQMNHGTNSQQAKFAARTIAGDHGRKGTIRPTGHSPITYANK